ncbi:hypothetical protein [Variovorax sp. PBL-E5]|uniref:hypothetical protein n=1 Tax=Variovorax sp. PBL-E5 TaxID=434014 RepID=UPI0013169A82|nr:hypothetical protein [Variovorax sp. PBL-E5]VTU35528.1 hypothetical protein E5CHR_04087 [Variovorax sp. PBL-E5]
MRLVVLKASSLQKFSTQLAKATAGGSGASLERLQALNPHIDFTALSAGMAIFLPDTPGLAATDSSSLDGGAFDAFAADLANGMQAAAARAKAGTDQLAADRSDVAAMLKTATLKRLLDGDATLKAQVDDVNAQFAKDQRNAQDGLQQIGAMQRDAAAEMAALGKLFGQAQGLAPSPSGRGLG